MTKRPTLVPMSSVPALSAEHPRALAASWGETVCRQGGLCWEAGRVHSRTQSGGLPLQVRLGRQVLVVEP